MPAFILDSREFKTIFIVFLAFTACALLCGCALFEPGSGQNAGPPSENDVFMAQVNSGVSSILGTDIPRIPPALNSVSIDGVVGEKTSEYSILGDLEKRLLNKDWGNEVRYAFMVDAQPENLHEFFSDADFDALGYAANGFYRTRKFGAGDPRACKNVQALGKGTVTTCVGSDCDEPACVHTFFKCKKWQVTWVIKSSAAQAQRVYAVDDELKSVFNGIC